MATASRTTNKESSDTNKESGNALAPYFILDVLSTEYPASQQDVQRDLCNCVTTRSEHHSSSLLVPGFGGAVLYELFHLFC